jgi:hypothetical protein
MTKGRGYLYTIWELLGLRILLEMCFFDAISSLDLSLVPKL